MKKTICAQVEDTGHATLDARFNLTRALLRSKVYQFAFFNCLDL